VHTCSGNNESAVQDQKISDFLSSVKHTLLVMSGKGGVGKSTVAANIATFLSAEGHSVGLLDIDMHGPSIAGLMGLTGFPLNTIGERIQPYMVSENLKVMSMQGFLQHPDQAVIWRGPLKIGVIKQLLADVDWGRLDYLIIDSPPGTGDEPLTVAQTVPGCQAVVVTTPQEVALADVRKSLHFCRQTGMNVLGIVENMSGFVCPDCGRLHNIFKSGGGEKTARDWGVPFLGKIPIDQTVVQMGDCGKSILSGNGPATESFKEIIRNIEDNLQVKKGVEKTTMRIAIPLADGKLCSHFGHCQEFAFVNVTDGKITGIAKKTPPPHEPGVFPAWLAQEGVDTILAGGMGERAQELFQQNGVKVVCGVAAGSPGEVVEAFLKGTLATGANPCSHDEDGHQCHGG
jgi:Mrp family chromosome partitioning ATPase/predicted Fe-Mo cluster-binding NifX family protein